METNGYLNSTDGRHTKIYLNTSLPRGLYEGFKLPSSLRGRLTGRGPVSRTLRQRMNGGSYLKKPWMNGLNHLKVLLEEESHKKQIG